MCIILSHSEYNDRGIYDCGIEKSLEVKADEHEAGLRNEIRSQVKRCNDPSERVLVRLKSVSDS